MTQGWRWRAAVACLVGLAWLSAAAAEPEPAQALLEQGVAAYQNGNYEKAVDELAKASSLAPDHSTVVLYLGLAQLKLGRAEKAIAAWEHYLKLEPSTKVERKSDLREKIPQYLTLLVAEENRRLAKDAVQREKTVGPGDPKTVAVTYYQNLGSPELLPLQKGLAALLIDDLSKVKELKVVERGRLQALLDEMKLGGSGLVDEKTAPKVGRLLGAGKVTAGSYVDQQGQEGEQRMKMASVVAESTTAAILSDRQTDGALGEFFEMEKALAFAHLKDLGYDENRLKELGAFAEIEKPQTKSMKAIVAFSNGLDAKDRRDYPAAREGFEEALREDEDFALAKKELLALPLLALTAGGIAAAVEISAPATAVTTASAAAGAGAGISTTALVVGGAVVAAGGAAGAAVASGALKGGGGGGNGGDGGGGGGGGGASSSLTGGWSGTVNRQSDGVSFPWTVNFQQTGSSFTATFTATNQGATETGSFSGQVNGNSLTFSGSSDLGCPFTGTGTREGENRITGQFNQAGGQCASNVFTYDLNR